MFRKKRGQGDEMLSALAGNSGGVKDAQARYDSAASADNFDGNDGEVKVEVDGQNNNNANNNASSTQDANVNASPNTPGSAKWSHWLQANQAVKAVIEKHPTHLFNDAAEAWPLFDFPLVSSSSVAQDYKDSSLLQ
jgi:hypothetical protein